MQSIKTWLATAKNVVYMMCAECITGGMIVIHQNLDYVGGELVARGKTTHQI